MHCAANYAVNVHRTLTFHRAPLPPATCCYLPTPNPFAHAAANAPPRPSAALHHLIQIAAWDRHVAPGVPASFVWLPSQGHGYVEAAHPLLLHTLVTTLAPHSPQPAVPTA